MTLPPLGPADLLVESGQNFVDGWTIQRVKDYGQACIASKERDTEAAVQQIMEAADEYSEEYAKWACAISRNFDHVSAVRAELERVVRETVR